MDEQSQTRNLQTAVEETHIHIKQANIKILISTSIRNEHDLVMCSSITVRCLANVEFNHESIYRDTVP